MSAVLLVDTGADVNFISQDLARQAHIPVKTLPELKTILGLNGEVLARITHRTQTITLMVSGNHLELIRLHLISHHGLRATTPRLTGQPGD